MPNADTRGNSPNDLVADAPMIGSLVAGDVAGSLSATSGLANNNFAFSPQRSLAPCPSPANGRERERGVVVGRPLARIADAPCEPGSQARRVRSLRRLRFLMLRILPTDSPIGISTPWKDASATVAASRLSSPSMPLSQGLSPLAIDCRRFAAGAETAELQTVHVRLQRPRRTSELSDTPEEGGPMGDHQYGHLSSPSQQPAHSTGKPAAPLDSETASGSPRGNNSYRLR